MVIYGPQRCLKSVCSLSNRLAVHDICKTTFGQLLEQINCELYLNNKNNK